MICTQYTNIHIYYVITIEIWRIFGKQNHILIIEKTYIIYLIITGDSKVHYNLRATQSDLKLKLDVKFYSTLLNSHISTDGLHTSC